jgi:protocatechuate 3,4-dioxygenase beta subunit
MGTRKHILWWTAAAAVVGLAYLLLHSATADRHAHRETAAPGAQAAAAPAGFVAPAPAPGNEPAALAIRSGELRLEGEVIDAEQHPIAGATVTLDGSRSVTTEADGAFAFDDLAEGDYRVTAEKDALYTEDRVTVSDSAEPTMLTLRAGATLVLHVVADGAPVPDAEVEVMGRQARTDPTGTVRLRGVELEATVVEITTERFAPARIRIVTGDDPRATVEKTIALLHGAPVAGTIVDPDGQPVPDATLWYRTADGQRSWANGDADGRWLIDRVPAGKLVLSARSPIHIAAPAITVRVDGEHAMAGVVVRVERGAVVSGIVVDGDGKPVAGAAVSAESGSAESGSAEADDAGRFEITGLQPGPCKVSASTATHGSAIQQLELAPGGRAEVRLVVVESRIAGRVTDPRGEPLPDINVHATRTGDTDSVSVVTDAAGRFELGGLSAGDYQLVADRDEDRSQHREPLVVHTGNLRVALVVADAATLTGRVVLDGQPVDYFGVTVTDQPGSGYSSPDVVRAPDGRFSVAHVPPGRWSVAIVGRAFRMKIVGEVDVIEGRTLDLGDIAVERGRTIPGHIRDERGAPVPGALVTVSKEREPNDEGQLDAATIGVRTARSDADGNYHVDGIDPDGSDLWIGAITDDGIAAAVPVDPAATTIDLVVERTGAITGEVPNERGESQLIATSAGGAVYYESTDPDHEFAFSSLTPGVYRVALHGDTVTAPVEVTVTGGAAVHVRLDPPAPIHLTIQVEPAEDCQQVRIEPVTSSAGVRPILAFLDCHDGVAEHPAIAPGRYRACPNESLCNYFEVTASPPSQLVVVRTAPPDDAAGPPAGDRDALRQLTTFCITGDPACPYAGTSVSR